MHLPGGSRLPARQENGTLRSSWNGMSHGSLAMLRQPRYGFRRLSLRERALHAMEQYTCPRSRRRQMTSCRRHRLQLDGRPVSLTVLLGAGWTRTRKFETMLGSSVPATGSFGCGAGVGRQSFAQRRVAHSFDAALA